MGYTITVTFPSLNSNTPVSSFISFHTKSEKIETELRDTTQFLDVYRPHWRKLPIETYDGTFFKRIIFK